MLTRLRRCSEHPPIWARVGLDLTAKRVGPYNRLADFVCFPTENPSQNGRYHQRQNTDQSSGMPHSGIPPSTGAGGERNGPVRRVRSVEEFPGNSRASEDATKTGPRGERAASGNEFRCGRGEEMNSTGPPKPVSAPIPPGAFKRGA